MKERPIIFNSEMVRAILDGRKTQTRRLRGLNKFHKTRPDIVLKRDKEGEWKRFFDCPYGEVGNRLWVRETWQGKQDLFTGGLDNAGYYVPDDEPYDFGIPESTRQMANGITKIFYRATNPDSCIWWRPSIYMPRWASRILLEITDVRVERVQEITQDDIIAEGLWNYSEEYREEICVWRDCKEAIEKTRTKYFAKLWDELNSKRGYPWSSNPYCWVITFEVVR